VALSALLILGARTTAAENLLANPGFEDLAGDRPVRWDHFVQPKPGATAELSDQAHSGNYAVWLHTPTPYEKEPVNNWSQNIIADFGGATLHVSGFIRVEDAKEAALWLQMWRKKPWGVMGAESTSIHMPVYGSQDWQEVSMEVNVPKGTDFVTLRCVLLGTGSAWFDDISVVRAADAPGQPKEDKTLKADAPIPPEAIAESDGDAAPVAPIQGDAAPEVYSDAEAPATSSSPEDGLVPMVNQLESEVRRLRDANSILTDTLEDIQLVNQELLKEMLSVQAELRALQSERAGAGAPPLGSSPRRVPPLMPLSQAHEVSAP